MKKRTALLKIALFGLLLLFMSKPASAQTASARVIKGVVIDLTDQSAMVGTTILLKGTQIGTITDADGKFEFPEKLKENDVLTFSSQGFENLEYTITSDTQGELRIEMHPRFVVMGEIAASEAYSQPTSGIGRFWSKVKEIF